MTTHTRSKAFWLLLAITGVTACTDAELDTGDSEDAVTIGSTCQTDLVATLGYRPPQVNVGDLTLAHGTLVPVPAALAVTTGNAGNGLATYSIVNGLHVTTCEYRGGASVLHPTTPAEVAAGKSYHFVACSGGVHAGQAIAADYVLLAVEVGDNRDAAGETVVTLPIFAADGTACDDGDACTRSDSCHAGACIGANPVTCGTGDACHAAGVCDVATGACSNPTAPDGTACNDGNGCTTGDTCTAGVCGGAPVACAPTDACHSPGACDPATGACSNPSAPDGTTCDDGSACTTGDTCNAGACVGSAVACPAVTTPCQVGACDATTGECGSVAVPDGTLTTTVVEVSGTSWGDPGCEIVDASDSVAYLECVPVLVPYTCACEAGIATNCQAAASAI